MEERIKGSGDTQRWFGGGGEDAWRWGFKLKSLEKAVYSMSQGQREFEILKVLSEVMSQHLTISFVYRKLESLLVFWIAIF